MDLVSWFPCVIAVRVPFPFDKVLKASFGAIKVVINDGFDLIFFCVLN
jgi:hypothetical protein